MAWKRTSRTRRRMIRSSEHCTVNVLVIEYGMEGDKGRRKRRRLM